MMEDDDIRHNQIFNALAGLPQDVIFEIEAAIYYKSNGIRQTDEAGSRRLIEIGKILHELMPEEVTEFDVKPEPEPEPVTGKFTGKWPGYRKHNLNTPNVGDLNSIWTIMPAAENLAVYALAHEIPRVIGAAHLNLDPVFAWWRGLTFDEKLTALRHAAER